MKLLLACFLIAVVIVFSKLMRRSVGKKTAPDSIQAITQPAVGRILVSDKTFNIPVVAIHCSNAQNVGFENPTYGKLQTFRRPQTPSENLWHKGRLKKWFQYNCHRL